MDISQTYGNDLEVSPTGDLLTSDGAQLTSETVARFVLTNPGDDSFDTTFGLGASQMVGEPNAVQQTIAICKAGLQTLTVIDQTQPIGVSASYDPADYALTVNLSYTDVNTALTISQSLPLD